MSYVSWSLVLVLGLRIGIRQIVITSQIVWLRLDNPLL